MARIGSFLIVLIVLAACEKRRDLPEPVVTEKPAAKQPEKKSSPAPKGVPQSLKDKIDQDWPGIKEAGDKFVVHFGAAQAAQRAGKRDDMQAAIDAAQKEFIAALEGWNGIYYSVDDYDEATAEKCRRYMRTWNRQVDGWTKKAKALKEFSRAK